MSYKLMIALLLCLAAGCNSNEDPADGGAPETDADVDASAPDGGATPEQDAGVPPCVPLFGAPIDATGLDDTLCRPECPCRGEGFAPPSYTMEEIDSLASKEQLNPPALLTSDPYGSDDPIQESPNAVCGLLLDAANSNAYRLETYENETAATAAGAAITHTGACGLCSSLENLAVYMRTPDLTDPVRTCGILGVLQGEQTNMSCLLELGFEEPCAQIWYYNTVNTRNACMEICTELLASAYHTADGALNACLQCDEENSGPVFKAVAGRTRRNSGLPTAICRPCDTVAQVVHDYF